MCDKKLNKHKQNCLTEEVGMLNDDNKLFTFSNFKVYIKWPYIYIYMFPTFKFWRYEKSSGHTTHYLVSFLSVLQPYYRTKIYYLLISIILIYFLSLSLIKFHQIQYTILFVWYDVVTPIAILNIQKILKLNFNSVYNLDLFIIILEKW